MIHSLHLNTNRPLDWLRGIHSVAEIETGLNAVDRQLRAVHRRGDYSQRFVIGGRAHWARFGARGGVRAPSWHPLEGGDTEGAQRQYGGRRRPRPWPRDAPGQRRAAEPLHVTVHDELRQQVDLARLGQPLGRARPLQLGGDGPLLGTRARHRAALDGVARLGRWGPW
eukprot:scaffold26571_cov66-Phaeocystis_antarctica.AAC.2